MKRGGINVTIVSRSDNVDTELDLTSQSYITGAEFRSKCLKNDKIDLEEFKKISESTGEIKCASSEDKKHYVQGLKLMKKKVAYVGNDFDDIRAMNEADVKLVYYNTDYMIKKIADVIIPLREFDSLIDIFEHARCALAGLRKFIVYK